MNVAMRREPAFDAIFADAHFANLVQDFSRYRVVRAVAARIIVQFQSAQEMLAGPRSSGIDVSTYAKLIASQRLPLPPDAVDAVDRTAVGLTALYQAHDPTHVRGATLEGLVEVRLRIRYRTGQVDNNVHVDVTNGTPYTTSTSIDVAGWDGAVGELHDCKVNPLKFEKDLFDELGREAVPRGFRIGLVCAKSFRPAAHALSRLQITVKPRDTNLLSLERLWDFAPLQQ